MAPRGSRVTHVPRVPEMEMAERGWPPEGGLAPPERLAPTVASPKAAGSGQLRRRRGQLGPCVRQAEGQWHGAHAGQGLGSPALAVHSWRRPPPTWVRVLGVLPL